MPTRRGKDEGSIYQRASDGKWCASVDLGWVGGKRKRKVVYGPTRKAVAEQLKKLHAEQQQGINIAPERMTVGEWLEYWLEHVMKRKNAITTYQRYRDDLRNHVIPAIGHIRLNKLTDMQVQHMLNSVQRIPHSQRKHEVAGQLAPLAPRTIRNIRAALVEALDAAVPRYAPRNVAKQTIIPRAEKSEIHPLTQAQARTLLAFVAGHALEMVYRVALSLGLRRGEIMALRWTDVDFVHGTITVSGTLRRIKHENGESKLERLNHTKTKASAARIPMPSILMAGLERRKAQQAHDRAVAGAAWHASDLVFTTKKGTPYEPCNVYRHFATVLKALGLPQTTRFHDLRHSCATLLIEQGVHPRVIMETLRHANIATTMDIYGHVIEETQRAATEALDILLASDAEILELPQRKKKDAH